MSKQSSLRRASLGAAFLAFAFFLNAQCPTCVVTCTATGNGNWGQVSTWNGTDPTTCNCFTIPSGITVTLNVSTTIVPDAKISLAGMLDINANKDLILTANSCIDIAAGGLIFGGNAGSSIQIGATVRPGPFNIPGIRMLTESTLLPVEMLFFEAKKVEKAAILRWATASEIGSDRFEIERSADGLTFETLGSVVAAGDAASRSNYFFEDEKPLAGRNFYRLRQIDFDETTDFSKIELVEFAQKGASVRVRFGDEKAFIDFETAEKGEAQLAFFDAAGRLIWSQKMALEKGQTTATFDFSGLPMGVFILQTTIDAEAPRAFRLIRL